MNKNPPSKQKQTTTSVITTLYKKYNEGNPWKTFTVGSKSTIRTTSSIQLLFCRNWSVKDAPMWHHVACGPKNGDVCSFSQQSTPPHSGKPPAVTHVPIFQTANKMTSRWCILDWLVSAKKPFVYYSIYKSFTVA